MLDNNISWPPPYTVKKHAKAKYVKFRASTIRGGLEITVPKRFSLKNLPEVLEENRDWILKQLAKLQLEVEWELPSVIHFPSVDQHWKIFYEPFKTRPRLLIRPGNEIVLLGDINDKEVCAKLLLKWVKCKAKPLLLNYLNLISNTTQLSYQTFTMRDQKTRWGSCTSEKNISLNYKLLFLSPELMRHVIIHELCHTKHLNHSDRFWQLVEKHDPNSTEHRRLLRKADAMIPKWILSSI